MAVKLRRTMPLCTEYYCVAGFGALDLGWGAVFGKVSSAHGVSTGHPVVSASERKQRALVLFGVSCLVFTVFFSGKSEMHGRSSNLLAMSKTVLELRK